MQVWGCESSWEGALVAKGVGLMLLQTFGAPARFRMVRAPGGSVWGLSRDTMLTGTLAPR